MSENNEEQLNDESHAGALDVGRRLRQAREAKGLAIDSVARDLHLNENLIDALENGRSEALPPATFVSGYLRGYGRLLGLDTDVLVRDYFGDEQSMTPLAPNAAAAEVRSSDAPVKAITYLIIIALAVLLVLWWLSRQPDEGVPSAEPEIESMGAGDTLELSLPPAAEVAPESEPVDAAPGLELQEPESADVVDEEGVAVETPEATPIAEPMGAVIEVSVNEDSWMEVYDSDGAQLVYGLYKGGRQVRVEGRAPFKVFFGYAPGVSLSYNGESVDVMRYKRRGNDTARFQLGTAEDNDR